MAAKIGFDAYGMTKDMPDPVAHAVNCLLDHMHVTDRQLEALRKAIEEANLHMDKVEFSEIEPCDIESTGDAGENP